MFPLIETIRLSEGEFSNLPYHAARMERAWDKLFQIPPPFALDELLAEYPIPIHGLFKYRVTYDAEMWDLEIIHYQVKTVTSLKLVNDDAIVYSHKFKDRSAIDALFAQRGNCDDVLIIRKGLVTDTSYANIIFKKDGEWITPESCLLPGTMRQSLIDQKIVQVREIKETDILQFETFKLINSMLLSNGSETAVTSIIR